ncbi:MAG: DUF3536 domain-containing protein [Anaerolineae bacterium]|nr:DUF3536 domain-containing protein [Anaerolineae bacterium]
MPPRPYQYFCVHSHFFQPPRGNPITGEIGIEPDADKYRNWNERITAESYRPNAEMGNFDRISFDVGEALMAWLRKRAPETHQRIVAADRLHQQRKRVGNAIANPFNDVLLPIRKRADKRTDLYWGKVAFQSHFGHDPQGVWLPEMAVDIETLQVVESLGYRFTILAQGQTRGPIEGAGPYWVDLQNGRKLAVFVRNDELSNDLAFNIHAVGGAGHWARNKLAGRRLSKGALILVATDGETFGHHHLGEERFLHWLIEHEAPAIGYTNVTLNEYLGMTPPRDFIEVKPFSSRNERHSIRQWVSGHDAWKSCLLRALDNLSNEINDIYREEAHAVGINPARLREEYIRVWLGMVEGKKLLAEFAQGLTTAQENRLLELLRAWVYLSKSYVSSTQFVDDPDLPKPRYAIGSAIHAAQIASTAVEADFNWSFRNDLYLVKSQTTGLNGWEIYDSVYTQFFAPPEEAAPVEAVVETKKAVEPKKQKA